MKIIVTIIPTDHVANLVLFSFCPFLQNQKQESDFHQVGGMVTRNIPVHFIVPCLYLYQLEFAEFDDDIYIICFIPKIIFGVNLTQRIKIFC